MAGAIDNVLVIQNLGDGTFAKAILHGAGESAVSVVMEDVDGDGDVDLAVAITGSSHEYAGTVSVLLNRCVP